MFLIGLTFPVLIFSSIFPIWYFNMIFVSVKYKYKTLFNICIQLYFNKHSECFSFPLENSPHCKRCSLFSFNKIGEKIRQPANHFNHYLLPNNMGSSHKVIEVKWSQTSDVLKRQKSKETNKKQRDISIENLFSN